MVRFRPQPIHFPYFSLLDTCDGLGVPSRRVIITAPYDAYANEPDLSNDHNHPRYNTSGMTIFHYLRNMISSYNYAVLHSRLVVSAAYTNCLHLSRLTVVVLTCASRAASKAGKIPS